MIIFQIIFIYFFQLSILGSEAEITDLLTKAEINIKNQDYQKAVELYKKAEEKAKSENKNLFEIYYKTAELYELMKKYNEAIEYYNKASELTQDEKIINIIADKLMILDEKARQEEEIIKEKTGEKKQTPTGIKKLKEQKGSFNLNSLCNVKTQEFKITKPVTVTGVRGADELHLDKDISYDNLDVRLTYIYFNDDDINEFSREGGLREISATNKKDKFHITSLVVTKEEEIEEGEKVAQVLINTFKKQNRYCAEESIDYYPVIFESAEFSNNEIHIGRIYYLNLLLQTLVRNTERPDLKYKCDIFFDENINAFTTTSGYIFISEEFLNILENEDELAAVLAHEISHIILRHHGKSETTNKVISTGLDLLLSNKKKEIKKAAEFTNKTLIKNQFSKKEEYEADNKAVEILMLYNFNPFALISVLEKFNKIDRIKNKLVGAFLNNHPLPEDRINRITKKLANVKEEEYINSDFEKRKLRYKNYISFNKIVDKSRIRNVEEEGEVKEKIKAFDETKKEEKKEKSKEKDLLKDIDNLKKKFKKLF